MVPSHDWDVVYLDLDDFYLAATEALNLDLTTVRSITDETLAGSALAAPAAGFGDFEQYPDFSTKVAVLIQAVASNHVLPDGNKRTSLLCAIYFARVNGFRWIEPVADDPDGADTAEVIESVAARTIPFEALTAWVEERLEPVAPPDPS